MVRRLAVALCLVVAIPAALLLAGLATLQIPAIQRLAADATARAVSTPPDTRVSLAGLDFGWPLNFSLDHLEIADSQGTWLTGSGLRLEWAPLRLGQWVLAIEHASAEALVVHRRPVPGVAASQEPQDEQPYRLPQLPLGVRIDRFLTNLVLAEGVAGTPVKLTFDGEGEWTAGKVRLALRAEQTGGGASIHADVNYADTDQRLQIDAGLDEPASQVMASLLSVPGLPPISVRVHGDGPLADWRGRVVAASQAGPCLTADVRLSRGVALEMAAEGGVSARCLDSETLRILAPDGVAFDVEAAWTERNRLHIGGAWLSAAVGSLSFGGAIVDGEAKDLRYELEVAELSRIGTLAGVGMTGRVALGGRVDGPLAAPVVHTRVASAAGSAAGVAWEGLDGGITLEPHGPQGWFVASDGRVIFDLPEAYPPVGEVFWRLGAGVDPAAELIRLVSLQVDSSSARLSALGLIGGWGRDVRLHLGLGGEDLAQLLAPMGAAVTGRAEIQLAATGNALDGTMRVVGGGGASRLGTGVDRLDAILGSRPGIRFSAAIGSGGTPFTATVAAAQGTVTAGGLVDELTMAGVRIDLPELQGLGLADVRGRAAGVALMAGGAGGLAVAGALDAKNVVAGGVGPLRARIAMGAGDLLAGPDLRVSAIAAGAGLEAHARAAVVIGEVVTVRNLRIVSGPDVLGGELAYRPDTGLLTGTLEGRVEDARRWSDLAGLQMAGSAAAIVRFRPEASGQGAELVVEASRLRLAEVAVAQARVTADIASLLTSPSGRVRVVASGVVGAGVDLASARLRADGSLAAFDFSIEADGRAREPLAFATGGQASLAGTERRVQLQDFDVAYGRHQATLGGPTSLVWGRTGLTLTPTVLALRSGQVTIGGTLAAESVDARLRLTGVPADLAELVMRGQDLVGTVSGEATITGRLPAPRVALSISGHQLGVLRAGPATRMHAELQGEWNEGRATLALRAVSGERVAAEARGSFPMMIAPESGLAFPEGGHIEGTIDIDADLARIADVLPMVGHRLAGQIRADIGIAGTVGQPEMTGAARLTQGSYENYIVGTSLHDITATASAVDLGRFDLVAQATDGQAGRLSVKGEVTVEPLGVSYALAATASTFRAVRLDVATAEATGNLRLEGRDREAALTGRLTVGRGEIDVGQALPARVVTLDVVEVNRPGGPRQQKEAKASADATGQTPLTLALNVALDVQRLFVRGRGLDSEWQGELVAGGTVSAPTLTGRLTAVRGRYDFLGRDFRLAESGITFDGGERINPRLDIVAESKAHDIVARVNLAGDARNPKIDFSSDPAYPSDEILSRLLFGKEAGQLTVAQQVQLARAAASLAGGGGGFDPVGSVRAALGLDVLEVGAGEGEEGGFGPTVSAGKYIDEDTFLRFEQGAKGGSVAIERNLGGGLSVETEVGQQRGSGVGLNWRKDY